MNLLRATAAPLAALLAVLLAGCAGPEAVTGQVTGRLMSEGGQPPGQRPMPGTVAFTAAGHPRVTVLVQNSGIFPCSCRRAVITFPGLAHSPYL